MLYYKLESTAERRARRNNDIKTLFQSLTIEEDSALTKTVKGFYDAFKTKYGHLATRKDYTLKCLGLD